MLVDSATHDQWQDILMNFVAFPGIGLILLWLFLVNTRFGEKLTWRTLLPMPLVGIAMAAVGFFATQPTKVLGDHCKAHVIKDVAGRTTGQTHELYGTVEYRFANGTTTELKGTGVLAPRRPRHQ